MNSLFHQSDGFNPVFLKEIRQSVRGLTIPLVLVLELLSLMVFSGFWLYGQSLARMLTTPVSRANAIDGFYWTVLLVSWLAGWSLVTLTVKRQVEERLSPQSGLVFLTRLTIGQFLRGLWLSGMAVGVLPLLASLPFWSLFCCFGRISVSTVAVCLVGEIAMMGLLLAAIIANSATSSPGMQALAWRRGIVPVCLVFGIFGPLQFGFLSYGFTTIPRGFSLWIDLLWLWCLLVLAGTLALAYGVAWAQLTIQVMPNSRSARWSRRCLQALVILIFGVFCLPVSLACWHDVGPALALPVAGFFTLLCLFSCWKIQRMGHPAQDGLWVSLCRAAGRRLAARRKPPASAAGSLPAARPEAVSGGVWLKLAFIERWPIFDAANPILVKDLRQALRNPVLPVVWLLAFVSGLPGLIRFSDGRFYGQEEYGGLLMFLLGCWLFIAISLLADRTREEAQSDSRDLLFATPLTPEQIVGGKRGMLSVAVAGLLVAMLPHALIWGTLTGQFVQALGLLGGFGIVALLAGLALLLLGLFPVNRTVFQLAVVSVIAILPIMAMVLVDLVKENVQASNSGLTWWLLAGLLALAGLLVALLGDCLFQLAVAVVRRRHGVARWLALLNLGLLPVLLLGFSVVAADRTDGTSLFFFSALVSLLAIGLVWRGWNWRLRRRRLPAAGGGR